MPNQDHPRGRFSTPLLPPAFPRAKDDQESSVLPADERDCTVAPAMPRERLRSAGIAALTDAELLALLLATGAKGQPVTLLAANLLRSGGGLRRISSMPSGQLEQCAGLGPAKASRIAAAFEMGRRVAQRPLPAGQPIASAADVAAHFEPHLRDRKQEVFLTLLLDGRHRLLRAVQVAEGSLTAAIVHPREALRPGVIEAAAALIFVHNHPSGDPSPSPEDLALTRKLVRAARLLAIDVLDHVIIGDGQHVSLASEGLMEPLPDPDPDLALSF